MLSILCVLNNQVVDLRFGVAHGTDLLGDDALPAHSWNAIQFQEEKFSIPVDKINAYQSPAIQQVIYFRGNILAFTCEVVRDSGGSYFLGHAFCILGFVIKELIFGYYFRYREYEFL